jgi:EAL domain-containing protein (putative c-di-GMP-specific phosphodiesterase class I)
MQHLRLSVNVSARQLQLVSLVEDVRGAIASSGLDPHQLILEVTESTIVKDVNHASDQLRALRATGVRIAIDDFGTGQSSLAQLQHLPVDELKIDRSFMKKLTDGGAGAAVAESVVNLGKALSLTVVVEGVETAEQVALLEAMSSDPMLQGFFFAEPLEPAEVEALIAIEAALLAPVAVKPKSLLKRSRKAASSNSGGSSAAVVPTVPSRSRRRARRPEPS